MRKFLPGLICLSVAVGCRSADSTSFRLNPFATSSSQKQDLSEEEIRENSRKFVENARQQSGTPKENYQSLIDEGQSEVMAWYRSQDPRNIAQAKKHFQRALDLKPQQPVDAHHGLAVVADLEGRFSDAERHYQLALSHAPSDARILGNLGYSYLLQDRYSDAERYLLRAADLDPQHSDAIRHLGDVYLRQGRFGEAQATYSRIMNSEQARQLVSQQIPPRSINEQQTLSGRIAPQEPQSASGLNQADFQELQRLRAEQRQSADRDPRSASGRDPHPSQAAYHFPGNQYLEHRSTPPAPHQLRDELYAIDQERYQNRSHRPVIIHAGSRELQQVHDHQRAPQHSGLTLTAHEHADSQLNENAYYSGETRIDLGPTARMEQAHHLSNGAGVAPDRLEQPLVPGSHLRLDSPPRSNAHHAAVYDQYHVHADGQQVHAHGAMPQHAGVGWRPPQHSTGLQTDRHPGNFQTEPANSGSGLSRQDPSYPDDYAEMSPYDRQRYEAVQRQRRAELELGREQHHSASVTRIPNSAARSSELAPRTSRGYAQQSADIYAQDAPPYRPEAVTPLEHLDPLQRPWGSQETARQGNYALSRSATDRNSAARTGNRTPQSESLHAHETGPAGHPQRSVGQVSYEQAESGPHSPYGSAERGMAFQERQRSHENLNSEAASLEAARMGMGLGPGEMFPTVRSTAYAPQGGQHSASQMPAGMNSGWNGNSFQQPPRMLPTNVSPLELKRLSQLSGMENNSGADDGSYVQQFGTASRYDEFLQQSSSHSGHSTQPDSRQLQQAYYEHQRQQEQHLQRPREQAQQHYDEQMRLSWEQRQHRPQPTPAPYGPVLRTADEFGTSATYSENSYEYLRAQQASRQSQSQGQPQLPGQSRQTSASPNEFVVPPPYTHASSGGDSTWGTADRNQMAVQPRNADPQHDHIQQHTTRRRDDGQSGNEAPIHRYQRQSNSGLPLIVPSTH